MQDHRDARGARVRRQARVPMRARRHFQADIGAEAAWHRRAAHSLLTAASAERRRLAVRRVAVRGGNVAPQSALHSLHGIRAAAGWIVRDTSEVANRVVAHFEDTWKVLDEAGREALDTFLAQRNACPVAWPTATVCVAVEIVQIAAVVCPEAVAHAVRSPADSDEGLRAAEVRGVPLGKKTSTPTVERVRMLLPLGTMMTVVNILIADELHAVCNAAPRCRVFSRALRRARAGAPRTSHCSRGCSLRKASTMHRGELCSRAMWPLSMTTSTSFAPCLLRRRWGRSPRLWLQRLGISCAGQRGVRRCPRALAHRGAAIGSRTAGA